MIDGAERIRGYACIGLDNPKFPENVGGALRAAGCYGAALVAVSGRRFGKHRTDTYRAYRHLPLLHTNDLHDVIPYDCVPVAVDLLPGAQSLATYTHPERAFYIFGAEDATLGERITSWCRDVIYIPTAGSMNLAACVNVVLYDRIAKRKKPERVITPFEAGVRAHFDDAGEYRNPYGVPSLESFVEWDLGWACARKSTRGATP